MIHYYLVATGTPLLFRNLQELSDSVQDVMLDANTTLQEALETSDAKIAQFQAGIHRGLAKQRYLRHLSDQYNGDTVDEEDKYCVLCNCDFSTVCPQFSSPCCVRLPAVQGFVTECAHVFCQVCVSFVFNPKV